MKKRNVSTNDNSKVKDDCHFTGKYRGAAHNAPSVLIIK